MKKVTYTTHDIGEICGVTMQTVIEWEKKGKLRAFKTLGGHRRIKEKDLIAFLVKNKIPIPDGLVKKEENKIKS